MRFLVLGYCKCDFVLVWEEGCIENLRRRGGEIVVELNEFCSIYLDVWFGGIEFWGCWYCENLGVVVGVWWDLVMVICGVWLDLL